MNLGGRTERNSCTGETGSNIAGRRKLRSEEIDRLYPDQVPPPPSKALQPASGSRSPLTGLHDHTQTHHTR